MSTSARVNYGQKGFQFRDQSKCFFFFIEETKINIFLYEGLILENSRSKLTVFSLNTTISYRYSP